MNLENFSNVIVPVILALITGGGLGYFFLPRKDYLKGKDDWIKKLEERVSLVEAKAIENQEKVVVLEYKVDLFTTYIEEKPDGHEFLQNANKKIEEFKKNTNQNVFMHPTKTTETVRVEYGGWIALVIGIICFTILTFVLILNDGTKKQIELEKAQIELQQKELELKQLKN